MNKYELNSAELCWLVQALNRDIAQLKYDFQHAEDGSPLQAIGELSIENREALVRKLTDIMNDNVKRIGIKRY